MRIAIIGGGAAGCFTAANIPYTPDVEVAVFEKTGKVMQKVKVSGGGKCNVSHESFDIPEMINSYPRGKQLLRKSLYRFGPMQTVDWFTGKGVQLKTEPDGRMFPITDDSQTIIDCIRREMMHQQAQVCFNKTVTALVADNGQFNLIFSDRSIYNADKVVVATGGHPKTEQYKWLVNLGHSIQPPVPSLFTFNIPKHPINDLMGVSVPDVTIKIAGTKLSSQGPILITHWGLSGPAVLKTSAIGARELANCNYEFKVSVNWLKNVTDIELLQKLQQMRRELGKQLVTNKNPFNLPRRLWEYILQQCSIINETRWGELPATAQNKLTEHLLRDTYQVKGKTTFKEEFVTCGGVSLSEINPQTMESRLIPGLYFAGELLNVDGITGGYNFQHAWSSGWIAAQSIRIAAQE